MSCGRSPVSSTRRTRTIRWAVANTIRQKEVTYSHQQSSVDQLSECAEAIDCVRMFFSGRAWDETCPFLDCVSLQTFTVEASTCGGTWSLLVECFQPVLPVAAATTEGLLSGFHAVPEAAKRPPSKLWRFRWVPWKLSICVRSHFGSSRCG